MDRVALDIETIQTVENPDFDDPSHWLPFAVVVGHLDDSMSEPEVEVIFREDSSIRAEARMLNETIDWIADRCSGSDRELLTYNGEGYDLPILKHRAREIRRVEPGFNVVERLVLLLETATHTDLILKVKEMNGHWTSLDDALDQHDIDADGPEWLGRKVTGADMPSMGLELMSDRPNDDLRRAVTRYAASDVGPLFELHDKLRRTPEP
jgi:hypothetical protein